MVVRNHELSFTIDQLTRAKNFENTNPPFKMHSSMTESKSSFSQSKAITGLPCAIAL